MKKVVNDTIQMLQKRREVADRKLYIYSGHDMNIASILSWLDVYEPHLPNYGAYIVFEIHIIHNIPYIKVPICCIKRPFPYIDLIPDFARKLRQTNSQRD